MKSILTVIIFFGAICFSKAARFYIPNGNVNALKSAINTANTNLSPDTIHLFPYGRYLLNTIDNSFVYGDNALPRIEMDVNNTNTLTILGNGAKLILDTSALDNVRILYIDGCKLQIYDLGFINGQADYNNNIGGAIFINGGNPSIDFMNCLFKGNSAYEGGALYITEGTINLYNCTFTNNNALFLGGAVTNLSGNVFFQNSVLVNNICTNTSGPGAIYNFIALNSPNFTNIGLYGSIVALNTYQHTSASNDGQEYDLAQNSAIYTSGNNFIGAYDNSTTGTPTPFVSGSPSSSNDYVGTSTSVLDPMLGTFARHYDYQESFDLLPGSLALNIHAGNSFNPSPAIASYGIFPDSGMPGDQITIYGKNFSHIIEMQFQGAADVTTDFTITDTSIVVTVPADAVSGPIQLIDWNIITTTSDQTFTIKTVIVTSLNSQKNKSNISFYPNPASDYLIVNSNGNSISISDLFGEELLNSNTEKIDISDLAEGMYLLKCGNEVKKFVKK